MKCPPNSLRADQQIRKRVQAQEGSGSAARHRPRLRWDLGIARIRLCLVGEDDAFGPLAGIGSIPLLIGLATDCLVGIADHDTTSKRCSECVMQARRPTAVCCRPGLGDHAAYGELVARHQGQGAGLARAICAAIMPRRMTWRRKRSFGPGRGWAISRMRPASPPGS